MQRTQGYFDFMQATAVKAGRIEPNGRIVVDGFGVRWMLTPDKDPRPIG